MADDYCLWGSKLVDGLEQELIKCQHNGRRTINGTKWNPEEEPNKKTQYPEEDKEERRRVEVLKEDQDSEDPKTKIKKKEEIPKIHNFFPGQCCNMQGVCKFILLQIFNMLK